MELPLICQKEPYALGLQAGVTYSWCTCGLSKEDPFCDGAHKNPVPTGFKSLKFTVPETGVYSLCGCKHSKNAPFCDGSHCKL